MTVQHKKWRRVAVLINVLHFLVSDRKKQEHCKSVTVTITVKWEMLDIH